MTIKKIEFKIDSDTIVNMLSKASNGSIMGYTKIETAEISDNGGSITLTLKL